MRALAPLGGAPRIAGVTLAMALVIANGPAVVAAQTTAEADANVVTTYEADANAAPEAAAMEPYQTDELADPLEPMNRVVFEFNEAVDKVVLRPVAEIYSAVFPPFLRIGISNVLANATSPVTLVNDVLQGEGKRAEETLVRFLVNTTVGFGGFVDAAQHAGVAPHREDFGQTLAVWGVEPGPYIMAPIIGPSTPRHLVGRVVDATVNPFSWLLIDAELVEQMSPYMAEIVTTREANLEQIDSLRASSPDFYATLKDVYYQRRLTEIRNGAVVIEELPDIPDFPQ